MDKTEFEKTMKNIMGGAYKNESYNCYIIDTIDHNIFLLFSGNPIPYQIIKVELNDSRWEKPLYIGSYYNNTLVEMGWASLGKVEQVFTLDSPIDELIKD